MLRRTFYDIVETAKLRRTFYDTVDMTPSHLDTVETAKPRRTFHDTAEAFHVTVETFYDTVAPSMTPPGGRFEYLTSSRVRQSSSFFLPPPVGGVAFRLTSQHEHSKQAP